jgi:hypothetical protein
MMNDPFFFGVDISGPEINFTNQIAQGGDSTNWSCAPRPCVKTFLIRSTETSFKLATRSTNAPGPATFLFALTPSSYYPGMALGFYAPDLVGYASVPCLIPWCAGQISSGCLKTQEIQSFCIFDGIYRWPPGNSHHRYHQ